jgi:hypothetical protein
LVLEKTLTTVRQWRAAERQVFLQNAAPLALNAALLFPERRELKYLALSVLETLAEKLAAADFEKIVPLQKVLQLDPEVTTPQKKRVLEKLVGIFAPEFDTTPAREISWRAILEQSAQFTPQQRTRMSDGVNERYAGGSEESMLRLLGVTESKAKDFAWLLNEELLQSVIEHIDFSGTPLDVSRIQVVAASQMLLASENRRSLADRLASLVGVSGRTSLDNEAQRAISALSLIEPGIFTPGELQLLATNLIQRVTGSAVKLRGEWLKPLLHIYSVLPEESKTSLESLLVKDFENPAQPDALVALLQSLSSAP